MTKSTFAVLALLISTWVPAAHAGDVYYNGTVLETESRDRSEKFSVQTKLNGCPDVSVYVIYPRGNVEDHPQAVTDDNGKFHFSLPPKDHFIALLLKRNGFVPSAIALEKFNQASICGNCNWDELKWERDGKRNYRLSADALITHEQN